MWRVIDTMVHDLGFMVAAAALRARPELRWLASQRRIGPGRSDPPEGVPVLETVPQSKTLYARSTFPAVAAQRLLLAALVRPDSESWDEAGRWLLWDTYQMIVTGKPSSRALG